MDTLVSSTDEAPLENSILSIEESGSGTLSTENMLRQVLQAVQALHDSVLRIAQPRQEGNVSNSRSSNISGDLEGQVLPSQEYLSTLHRELVVVQFIVKKRVLK